MTRPEIIRADTIDLQDHQAPSAKDHSRQPAPATNGTAPHQAETLREVAAEAYEEQNGDPRPTADWNTAEAELMQHFNGEGLTADEMEASLEPHHHDTLAVAQNGGHGGDESDGDEEDDDGMDDDFTDKISSSPSIDDEDIDFEFVYALHTFVATVEGQANATKGDTMVLLDDSNSYWWLVRVVKDSSIGYLPAEHIETPTERLARLNKHRNVDLSQAMLGDPGEKSKNPIKKVIRRRNAKTVTFGPPAYVEPEDIDYSSDEDDMDAELFARELQQQQQAQQQKQQEQDAEKEQTNGQSPDSDDDDIAVVEPIRQRAEIREVGSEPRTSSDGQKTSSEGIRHSEESYEKPEVSKSRNGTVRNTDSFYKDETVETRKITLTPNLLRDDTPTARTSNDSRDYKPRVSLDKDREEKTKDDGKKKKDKKSGMLSGLFKRKDKRSKDLEDPDELIYGKRSSENSRSSPVPSKDSEELASEEQAQAHAQAQAQAQAAAGQTQSGGLQRSSSKLQKQPKAEQNVSEPRTSDSDKAVAPGQASLRLVQAERELSEEPSRESLSREAQNGQTPNQNADTRTNGSFSTVRTASSGITGPEYAKQSAHYSDIDEYDSPEEIEVDEIQDAKKATNGTANNAGVPSAKQAPYVPGAFPDSAQPTPASETTEPLHERLSESPVQVSPVDNTGIRPPALVIDTSSQEEPPSPVSTASPDLGAIDGDVKKVGARGAAPSSPVWNDNHLRAFFEDDSEIKDLLIVVYDKTGVVPAGPEHPVTGTLFKEEKSKLSDLTNQLDSMLGDWLARKSRSQG